MKKSVDKVMRQPVTKNEAGDVQTYMKLAKAERIKGKLAPSELKRFHRVRARLLRAGVIQEIGRAQLEATAREALADLTWWRRWLLKIKFRIMIWRKRRAT